MITRILNRTKRARRKQLVAKYHRYSCDALRAALMHDAESELRGRYLIKYALYKAAALDFEELI